MNSVADHVAGDSQVEIGNNVEALKPRRIVAGHQNKQLVDDAERTIAETRQYLDDADDSGGPRPPPRLLYAKIERHPNHLGRTVLWAAASAPYGVRDHPGEDIGQILVAGWL